MSNLIPFFAQSFPPRSKFATSQIPDLSRKVVIVTGACTSLLHVVYDTHRPVSFVAGATAGVGKETAKV